LKGRGETLLFPELQRRAPNTALENTFEKVWAPILDAALPNRKDEKKSLHSLRHRGNNWLIKRKVLDVIRYAIMGQAGKTVNEKVYTEPFPDETLLEALANLPDVTAELIKTPLCLSPILDERD
jgi:integrase